jgi:phytoene desaturase
LGEVVVVGAGVGGLAVAARLARAGHQVTVCEQADRVGGKLGVLERDGFRFDTGPSLLTMPHVFEELFAATGDPLAEQVTLRRVEPVAHYHFADGTEFDASAYLSTMVANLERLAPGSGAQWKRFLDRAARAWDASRQPFLESALDSPRRLISRRSRPRDLVAISPWLTLRQLARRHFDDPRLVMFVDRYATYSGSDPRRAPAVLSVVPYVEQRFGAWYVDGGLARLGDALAARAVECGACLRTGADVIEVEVAHGRVSGVRLAGGERVPADVVVSDIDATSLYESLVHDVRTTRVRHRLARAPRSLSGFVLLLGVRGRTPDMRHHTVLFPRDYDAEFDDLFGSRPQPVREPTLYIAKPDDPAVAPPGDEAWFVLVNAPRQGQAGIDWDHPGVSAAYADRLLEQLAARGLDVTSRIVFREIITPADLARRTRAVGGAIYGTSSNGLGAAFFRPPNRSPVPGLFLVGGSTHPGGGLPLVALSARIVADLVNADAGGGRHPAVRDRRPRRR